MWRISGCFLAQNFYYLQSRICIHIEIYRYIYRYKWGPAGGSKKKMTKKWKIKGLNRSVDQPPHTLTPHQSDQHNRFIQSFFPPYNPAKKRPKHFRHPYARFSSTTTVNYSYTHIHVHSNYLHLGTTIANRIVACKNIQGIPMKHFNQSTTGHRIEMQVTWE